MPRSAVAETAGAHPAPVVVELDETWAERDPKVCVRRRDEPSGFARALVEALTAPAAPA